MLHTSLRVRVAVTGRTIGRSLGTTEQSDAVNQKKKKKSLPSRVHTRSINVALVEAENERNNRGFD
jgi:hypothetical protein